MLTAIGRKAGGRARRGRGAFREALRKWILETPSFFVWQGACFFCNGDRPLTGHPRCKKSKRRRANGINQRFFGLQALAALALALLLCSCAAGGGREAAGDIALGAGFAPMTFQGETFTLKGWLKPGSGETLRVYMEGDGRSWETRRKISRDPTPGDPVGFKLAAADASGDPVLYLARPGQYLSAEDLRQCPSRYWAGARLAPEVISDMDRAVSAAKAQCGAEKTALYGFSGGGGAAVLVAARRDDAVFLGTAAGLLDHARWTAMHGVSPLNESLNPIDFAPKLAGVPQMHLSGGRDAVMPPGIAEAFCREAEKAAGAALCRRIVLPEAGHAEPWPARHFDEF